MPVRVDYGLWNKQGPMQIALRMSIEYNICYILYENELHRAARIYLRALLFVQLKTVM